MCRKLEIPAEIVLGYNVFYHICHFLFIFVVVRTIVELW